MCIKQNLGNFYTTYPPWSGSIARPKNKEIKAREKTDSTPLEGNTHNAPIGQVHKINPYIRSKQNTKSTTNNHLYRLVTHNN